MILHDAFGPAGSVRTAIESAAACFTSGVTGRCRERGCLGIEDEADYHTPLPYPRWTSLRHNSIGRNSRIRSISNRRPVGSCRRPE